MLACGGERMIENRGNGNIEIGRAGKFAVFGIVEGALEVVNAGADVNASGERGLRSAENCLSAVKVGRPSSATFNLAAVPCARKLLHFYDEAGRQVNGIEQAEQSASRVGAGNDAFRGDFFAT